MEEHTRKHTPLTRKIKRVFVRRKAKQAHKLYPEEYFKQYWLSRGDANGVKAIARLEGKNQKAMLHQFCEEGIQNYMRKLVKKDLDDLATPEGRAAQAKPYALLSGTAPALSRTRLEHQ